MKKCITFIVVFLVGTIAGLFLSRTEHFRGVTKMVQRDTIVRYDTLVYSRLELLSNTYKLDLPRSKTEFVYIPEESVSIIYRDSIRYVTLPREFYFTQTEDAQIWHSGIDSRIDSLVVFRKSSEITQTVTRRNELSIGIEASYSTYLRMPLRIEYSYQLRPWISVYGYAEQELFRKQFGVGVGGRISLGW